MASSITLINYVPLLLSLLVLAFVAPSTSNPTAKLTHATLKRVCLASGNPRCLRTLRHDPQIRTLNVAALTLSYVEKARNRASSTVFLIEDLLQNLRIPKRELLFKYRHCWNHYRVAESSLDNARQRLKSRNFNGIADLAITAFTRASDCDDEFDDRKFPEPVELDRSNHDLRALGGIVLGLAKELHLP